MTSEDLPTPQELAHEIEITADAMQQTGERMVYFGGFGPIAAHGREMIGAAKIAHEWAEEMLRVCAELEAEA